jgi:PST family polysaccharide transporter
MRKIARLLKRFYRAASEAEIRAVLENAFSLSTLQGVNYLLPLAILPYLVRVLGPEKFGLIAFAQAFTQFFFILTDYGFSVSATREISLCREHKEKVSSVFSSVMTVKLLLSGLAFLALLAAVSFFPRFRQEKLVYLFSFGTVLGNTLFPVWLFQGQEKMRHISALNIGAGIAFAAAMFILVKGPADYLLVPLIHSCAFITSGLAGLYLAFRHFGVRVRRTSYADIRRQARSGWDIFISIVAINGYTASRVFCVGLLGNNTTAGYYAIAERIANVIQTFPLYSFSQAVFPRLSRIYARSRKRAFAIMEKIQETTTATAALALPVIFLAAPWLVKLACGRAYPQVIVSLRLLLLSVFYVNANAFKVQFLLIWGRTDLYSRIHIAVALVGLPLIVLLTCYFSYLGAAFSTVITEALIFILTFRALKGWRK